MAQSINLSEKYEILTPSGWSNFEGLRRKQTRGTILFILENGKSIECTVDHKLKMLYGYVEAKVLTRGDEIQTDSGMSAIQSIFRDTQKEVFVYDALEVQKRNEYYTNGILSHNCEFQGSSGTLISGEILKQLVHQTPVYQKNGLKIYDEPEHGRNYACVVDVSRGKGLDYSAFQMIDVTKMPYKQVAVFRDNLTPPMEYAQVLVGVLNKYNQATVLVEINDIGGQIADLLHYDYEYENIIKTQPGGSAGKRISMGGKGERGVRTTKTVKNVGCSILKLLIEQQQLILKDFDTVAELSTFSAKGTSYEAEPGCNDDLAMGLVLFAWLSNQKYFKEMTDINTLARLREKTEDEIEQWMTPFGVRYDAAEELEAESSGNIYGGSGWTF